MYVYIPGLLGEGGGRPRRGLQLERPTAGGRAQGRAAHRRAAARAEARGGPGGAARQRLAPGARQLQGRAPEKIKRAAIKHEQKQQNNTISLTELKYIISEK